MEYFNHFWPVCKLKTAAAGRAFQGALPDGRTAPRQSLEQRVIAPASQTPTPGSNRYFLAGSSKRIHVRSLSPRRSGPRTVISQLRSWVRPANVRPDTPRVVNRGRWGVVPFFRTVGMVMGVPRSAALARQPADGARARQVHHQRSADERRGMGSGAS
jgi:hypothetical protein